MQPLLQSLSIPIAINILLDDTLNYNDMVDDIVKAISSTIHTNRYDLERLDRNTTVKFLFGEIEYLILNPQTTIEVQQYFHVNSTEHVSGQIVNTKELSLNMALDPLASLKRVSRML